MIIQLRCSSSVSTATISVHLSMAATAINSLFPAILCVQPRAARFPPSLHSSPSFVYCKPLSCCFSGKPSASVSRERKLPHWRPSIFALQDGIGSDQESGGADSESAATIDLKLPRRKLLVQFTCNECGERTSRLVNPLAYEKGLVFVQCAGCLRHHKLVDNLGLIVEYDFRKESNDKSDNDPQE